jgi:hypothetical protein
MEIYVFLERIPRQYLTVPTNPPAVAHNQYHITMLQLCRIAARQITKPIFAGVNHAATGQSPGNPQIKTFRHSTGGELCCYRIADTLSE